jgi:hypothetical protein
MAEKEKNCCRLILVGKSLPVCLAEGRVRETIFFLNFNFSHVMKFLLVIMTAILNFERVKNNALGQAS